MLKLNWLATHLIIGLVLVVMTGCADSHSWGAPGRCPPGLADKGGMPPGQAKKHGYDRGDSSSASVDVDVNVRR